VDKLAQQLQMPSEQAENDEACVRKKKPHCLPDFAFDKLIKKVSASWQIS